MKDSKYEAVNLNEVVESQSNMTPIQKGKFYEMMKRINNLFVGKKGKWKGPKVSIELKSGAKLVQS